MEQKIKQKITEMYEAGCKSDNPYMRFGEGYPDIHIDTVCFDKVNNKAVYLVFEADSTTMVEVDGTVNEDNREYYMFEVVQTKSTNEELEAEQYVSECEEAGKQASMDYDETKGEDD